MHLEMGFRRKSFFTNRNGNGYYIYTCTNITSTKKKTVNNNTTMMSI